MSATVEASPAVRGLQAWGGGEPAAWRNPTAVLFGIGAADGLGRHCAGIGAHALLVTDRDLARGAIVERARRALEDAGCRVTVSAQLGGHPPLAAVRRGIVTLRAAGADLVVGLGGGSAMDVAKVIAGALRNPALIADPGWSAPAGLVAPDLERPRPAAALVQVPTTSGTGSEVSAGASLIADDGDKKLLVHPLLSARLAIIDPALAVTVPPRQTARGSVETVCRLLLPYLTETRSTPLQDRFAETTARVVVERTPTALRDGGDLAARAELALVATSSMMGWLSLGRSPFGCVLWYLQNALATVAGLPKGDGLAALLPAYLRCLCRHADRLPQLGSPDRLLTFARSVLSVPGMPTAAAAVDELCAHLRAWGLPLTLGEAGVGSDRIPRLVERTMRAWGDPRILGWLPPGDLEALYAAAC